jgi:ribosomal protein S27E
MCEVCGTIIEDPQLVNGMEMCQDCSEAHAYLRTQPCPECGNFELTFDSDDEVVCEWCGHDEPCDLDDLIAKGDHLAKLRYSKMLNELKEKRSA